MARKSKGGLTVRQVYVDRVIGGVTLLALHEAGSLQAHIESAAERLRVARKARGLGELLRDQIDLLPESRNRWRRDHQVRRELLRGLIRDLKPLSVRRSAHG